ncbi:hypothetical protein MP638_003313 [Amoeboaphelidium occidentale]|nr:hypothetical protein MP638_003313 [Amoeboaphelidium occidentale]
MSTGNSTEVLVATLCVLFWLGCACCVMACAKLRECLLQYHDVEDELSVYVFEREPVNEILPEYRPSTSRAETSFISVNMSTSPPPAYEYPSEPFIKSDDE